MKRITLIPDNDVYAAGGDPREFFPDTISAVSLINPDALSHVASLFAPSIEDNSWLLKGSAPSTQRFYDWIV